MVTVGAKAFVKGKMSSGERLEDQFEAVAKDVLGVAGAG